MARNTKWTQPLSVWKEYFSSWINNSDPQSILDTNTFFDFRCVYGENIYTDQLKDHVHELIESRGVFFYHMATPLIKYKLPISMFGNIVGETSTKDHQDIDIKKIIHPVISFIRIYALQNKLHETNSHERLNKLHELNVLNKQIFNEIDVSYNYLMLMRFKFQLREIMQNKTPDNLININELTHIEKTTLKKIFSEISNLQTKLSFDFKGTM